MQTIIETSETDATIGKFYYNRVDGYQKVITQVINPFLPWVLLIALINRKNMGKPINLLLIFHYIFRFIGLSLLNTENVRINVNENPSIIYPYTEENWKISYAIANIFWTMGELCADWYPFLRTKAATKNNLKNIKPVVLTCVIYNLAKLYAMISFFINPYVIFKNVGNITEKESEAMTSYNTHWWIVVAVIQVASLCYELSIIWSLRKSLFNRLKEFHGASTNGNFKFLRKFQQISEYRIIFSMVASLLFLPFILLFVYLCFYKCLQLHQPFDMDTNFALESLRQTVIDMNCNFMYIDQILLRFVVFNNNKNRNNTHTNGHGYISSDKNSIATVKNNITVVTSSIMNHPNHNTIPSAENISPTKTISSMSKNLPLINNNNMYSMENNLSYPASNRHHLPSKDISSFTNISLSSNVSSATNLSTTTSTEPSTANLITSNSLSLARHLVSNNNNNNYSKINVDY